MTTPLYITESEVESLFTMEIAVDAVEQAFVARSKGRGAQRVASSGFQQAQVHTTSCSRLGRATKSQD